MGAATSKVSAQDLIRRMFGAKLPPSVAQYCQRLASDVYCADPHGRALLQLYWLATLAPDEEIKRRALALLQQPNVDATLRLLNERVFPQEADFWTRYRNLGALGRGADAYVYRVEAPDGQQYALKQFFSANLNRSLEEIATLEALQRAGLDAECGLVRIKQTLAAPLAQSDGPLVPSVLEELVEGSSLHDLLQEALDKRTALSAPAHVARVERWLRDLLAQLACLHERGAVHRDVKLQNVLIDAQDRARLIDYDTVCLEACRAPVRGTWDYLAPELLRGGAVQSAATDLWALGIVAWMLVYKPAFALSEADPLGDFEWLQRELDEEYALKPLIQALLQPDPSARPNARDALALLS